MRKRPPRLPLLKTSRLEVVPCADSAHPRAHPPLECRPTARRLEQVTSDMGPAQGQHQLRTLPSQALVGTGAVTHQHDFDQVFASLATMPLGNVCPAPGSHLIIHHSGRRHHPQRPAMPRCAVALFTYLPACCIAMEELCCPLPLVEHRHQRRQQPREALQASGDGALGQRATVRRQLLTYAVGGTARALCVQQHHRPYGHPQGALRDHTRDWRRRHHTWAWAPLHVVW